MLAVNWTVGTDVELALKELAVAEDHYEAAKRSLSAAKKASSSHSIPPMEGEIRQNFFHFKNKNLLSDFL